MQKIHVRNIFKIFVPLAFPADYTLAPLKAPFGFALTDKRTLNYYQYHMQMFYMSNEKNAEEEAANCFAWGKRNPLYVKYKPNTDQIEGVILQVKVNHYVFDFRRIKERAVRVNVDCFNSTQSFLSRGSSALLKLLPKKRKNEDYEDDNEDEPVNINWEQTGVNEHVMPGAYVMDSRISPDSPINYSNSSPNSQSEHGVHSNESIHVSDGYEPISISFPDFPIQQQDEHYMVLYNGNAEVIGNFRALNFYKASDINIKEDIRLLSDDHDCRDTLMRINGVNYKFKPGVHPNVNKRFVGYIAQQVESVVPSAVQLIDGILHVDYESLIPYLSESIRQNFNDIKNIKADNEKIYQAIDSMYETFINKDNANPSSITPLIDTQTHKHYAPSTSIGTKILIVCMAVAFVVAGAFGLFYWQHSRTSGQTNPEAIPVSPIAPGKLPLQPLQPTLPISAQRQALQALYIATNGKNWDRQDNWLTDKSICTWYGVQCSMFGEDVVVLVLANNNLNGTIPESINLLTGLRGLNLADNNLHGTLPASIYNMTHILQIQLTFNNLEGTISPEIINLPFLHTLELSRNKFSGTIPVTLSYMNRVARLMLRRNNFTGTIPSFVPGRLLELDLGFNNFTGTLPDFSKFEELSYLSVEYNQLEGTIQSLPPSLRSIMFSNNHFDGTVDAFSALDRTSATPIKIDISHNQLSGDIGPLMQYPALVFLNAAANNFTMFSTMSNNTSPEFQCHAYSNPFACPLPPDADKICGATCT